MILLNNNHYLIYKCIHIENNLLFITKNMKYNWINIPDEISPFKIVSAFANPVDTEKVSQYTEDMQETFDIEYTFPPIMWFPEIVTNETLEEHSHFMWGDEITEDDLWSLIWNVTDWHHRVLAACNAWKKYISLKLDRSTITNEDELMEYDKEMGI